MDSGIRIKSFFYVGLALSFILIPVQWVLAWFTAAVIHELCHLLAMRLFHCDVKSVSFGMSGAVIVGAPMSDFPAIICALAGPVGSFMLVLLSKWMPRVAVCGLIQCVYNLIPLQPLDGCKILERILSMCFSNSKQKIITIIIRCMVLSILILVSIVLSGTSLGPIPLFIVLMMILNSRKNSLQNDV